MADETSQPATRWYKRIGSRIFAVAAVSSLVPVILIGLLIFTTIREDLVRQTELAQKNLAGSVRQGLTAIFQEYIRAVRLLASDTDIQVMKADIQRQALYRFFDLNPLFYSSFIYDRHGVVRTVAFRSRDRSYDKKFIGFHLLRSKKKKNIKLQKAFNRCMETGETVILSDVFTREGEQNLLLVMVPIPDFIDRDSYLGVVSMAINIEGAKLSDLVDNAPLGAEDILVLANYDGTVLAVGGELGGAHISDMRFNADRVRRREIVPANLSWNGIDYLGIVTGLPKLNFVILTAKPAASVFGFMDRILVNALIILVVALIAGFVFSYMMAASISDRLRNLAAGIRRVREGVVSHRVPVEGDDELAEACEDFNDMAATFEKHRLMDEIWARKWREKSESTDDD